jgi:hypothetical protein
MAAVRISEEGGTQAPIGLLILLLDPEILYRNKSFISTYPLVQCKAIWRPRVNCNLDFGLMGRTSGNIVASDVTFCTDAPRK